MIYPKGHEKETEMKVKELLDLLKGKEEMEISVETDEGYFDKIEVLVNDKKKIVVLREDND